MNTTFGASLGVRMDDSVEEYADFLDSLGLSHVEIRWNYLDTREHRPSDRRLRDIRESREFTYTIHAPYGDANPGSLNEGLRRATTDRIVEALDTAAAIGAGAVVVHGGSTAVDDTLERLGIEPEYVENPIDDDVYVHDTLADASKLREATGWEPEVEFEEGLRRVCEPYL